MIIAILASGSLAAVAIWFGAGAFPRRGEPAARCDASMRNRWRMPPVASLAPRRLSARTDLAGGAASLLLVAAGLVLVRIVTLLTGAGSG